MSDGVPCMILRGGSSKGAYFVRDDLPAEPAERAGLLRRIMGSPDARQIDGIGGAHPLTSKVAVVSPASDDDADIDYLFLQVGVDDDVVSDRQNCGNLLAGVGPYALERSLVSAPHRDGEMTVRIRMVNTDSIATARFAVRDGAPVFEGTTAISGVPGTAAAVHLEFHNIAGDTCGALLPTGRVRDVIEGTPCTLVDHGMPVVVIPSDALGVSGDEPCAELETNAALRAALEDIRLRAGELMGLGDVRDTTVPKLTLVSPARHGGSIATRTFIPHRCHDAIGVFGAVSVATAALLDGSPAHAYLGATDDGIVRLEHPTGHFDALVEVQALPDGTVEVGRADIIRTARKLMDGVVFPRSDEAE